MKNVLYFTADWCQPCKRTRPIVEAYNRENPDINFNIIDIDIEKEMASNFKINGIPTFILLNDGVETKRTIGAKTKQQLKKFLQDN